MLQPSQYEPFALTVGEALAGGTPVIASDEVGAAEGIDPRVCQVFPRGDRDALQRAVRDAIGNVDFEQRGELAALARAEAERLFAPATVAATLLEELERARAVGSHDVRIAAIGGDPGPSLVGELIDAFDPRDVRIGRELPAHALGPRRAHLRAELGIGEEPPQCP